MEPDCGIWNRLTRGVAFLLVVATVVLLVQLYIPLFKKNQELRQRNLQLETQIQKEEELAKHFDQSIELLSKDPAAIERLAREQLGFAKPGEMLFRFQPAGTNSAPARR